MFDVLLEGADPQKARDCLQEIIKIRAVQQFSASQAVGFVFRLKDAVRKELGKTVTNSRFASELTQFEGRVDEIALAAFDIFVECRKQVYELRVNEVKRRVSWIVDKLNKRGLDPELTRINLE